MSFRADIFFCNIFVGTGQAPDYATAYQLALTKLKALPMLCQFYDELRAHIKWGCHSDFLPVERRLTNAFDASRVIDAAFGYKKNITILTRELKGVEFHSSTFDHSIIIKRHYARLQNAPHIGAVGPSEQAAKQQAINRYALLLLGHLAADDVELRDRAVQLA